MNEVRDLLKGAYDLHIHSAPDVVKRKSTDVEIARSVIEKGMKGYVVKSHYFNTAGRAAIIREMFPECNAIGGLVLNNSVGGLNPEAVEMASRAGTKIVWFPTMDAQNMWDYMARSGMAAPPGAAKSDPDTVKGISLLKNGKLKKEVFDIIDLIKENDMVLATGHISPEESMALIKEAGKRGVEKMILTHAEFPPTYSGVELQKEFIQCGAKIEHNYLTIVKKEFTLEKLKEQILAIGAENIILSSDMGQAENPKPIDGFETFIRLVWEMGIKEDEIRKMIVENPREIVED